MRKNSYICKRGHDKRVSGFYGANCRQCTHDKYDPKVQRTKVLKYRYGITDEIYNELFKSQDYKCALCRTSSPNARHSQWHIDHNHTTGKIRGILCGDCNVGLGHFKDSTLLLILAKEYLEKEI